MGSFGDNVNVYLEELKRKNVNVREKRAIKKATEARLVYSIMNKLGPDAKKDEAYWHKVARSLSEEEIQRGLDIAEQKKPAGPARIRYIGGIYSNMMRSHGIR